MKTTTSRRQGGQIDANRIHGRFDPFSDRRSRDIRNSLSTALIEALEKTSFEPVGHTAASWLALPHLSPACGLYVRNRLARYRKVFDQTRREPRDDLSLQLVILWNNGLFFEVHELVEKMWQGTRGDQRLALKGMIQAAGVFVHLEAGNGPAARRLAAKARALIHRCRARLDFIRNIDDLLQHLTAPDPTAPRLVHRHRTSAGS